MPKKSVAKSAPKPIPVKAPKTRLTKSMRDTLHRFMKDAFRKRLDSSEISKTLVTLVDKTNAILRAKYPEDDMPVLRKYEMVRVDQCLRFTLRESGRVFGVQFNQRDVFAGEAHLADIPCRSGCYNHDVYPCDSEFAAIADLWEKQVNERCATIAAKDREYESFLLACRYLEEVEVVVPLTDQIRKEIGAQSRSLTVINPEILSRIKSDFAKAA